MDIRRITRILTQLAEGDLIEQTNELKKCLLEVTILGDGRPAIVVADAATEYSIGLHAEYFDLSIEEQGIISLSDVASLELWFENGWHQGQLTVGDMCSRRYYFHFEKNGHVELLKQGDRVRNIRLRKHFGMVL